MDVRRPWSPVEVVTGVVPPRSGEPQVIPEGPGVPSKDGPQSNLPGGTGCVCGMFVTREKVDLQQSRNFLCVRRDPKEWCRNHTGLYTSPREEAPRNVLKPPGGERRDRNQETLSGHPPRSYKS